MVCCWLNPSHNMKTKSDTPLPALPLPRLSSKLEEIADHLARVSVDFGIDPDENFPARVATVGFVNGVQLGQTDAAAATRLTDLLAAEDIPSPGALEGFVPILTETLERNPNWTQALSRVLEERWRRSPSHGPDSSPRLEMLVRVLHGIAAGLFVARENPETAGKVVLLTQALRPENRFMSERLSAWRANDWQPAAAPFLEFAARFYEPGSLERELMTRAFAEVHPIAMALNNPWDLNFWAETGWNGGRRFAARRQADCRALLTEVSSETLKNFHDLFQRCVLGTARGDGEVQIGRASLYYFGIHSNPDLARYHLTGRESRHLARYAFDFAFWMGIFASFPVPGTNA